MTDPARIEAALRTLHGMTDMGCRKANGASIEDCIDKMSRKASVKPQDEFMFTMLVAISCMKEMLDGDAPMHSPDCTIYQHEAFDPENCTCGVEARGTPIDLGHGAAISEQLVNDAGLSLNDITGLVGWVNEQASLLGGDLWKTRGPELLQARIKEIVHSKTSEESY